MFTVQSLEIKFACIVTFVTQAHDCGHVWLYLYICSCDITHFNPPKMFKNDSIFSDPELNLEIEKNAKRKSISKGTVLMNPGDDILFIPIVLKGSIRVIRQDTDGQEVFLYHLYPVSYTHLTLPTICSV